MVIMSFLKLYCLAFSSPATEGAEDNAAVSKVFLACVCMQL